eukprot:CFRG1592T1
MANDPGGGLHLSRLWTGDRKIRLNVVVIGAEKCGKSSIVQHYVGSNRTKLESLSQTLNDCVGLTSLPSLTDSVANISVNGGSSGYDTSEASLYNNVGGEVSVWGMRTDNMALTRRYTPTVEDVYQVKFKTAKEKFNICVTDTSGKPDTLEIFIDDYLQRKCAFILVYSVVDENSIVFLEEWSKRITQFKGTEPYIREFIVIGTKRDLVGQPLGGNTDCTNRGVAIARAMRCPHVTLTKNNPRLCRSAVQRFVTWATLRTNMDQVPKQSLTGRALSASSMRKARPAAIHTSHSEKKSKKSVLNRYTFGGKDSTCEERDGGSNDNCLSDVKEKTGPFLRMKERFGKGKHSSTPSISDRNHDCAEISLTKSISLRSVARSWRSPPRSSDTTPKHKQKDINHSQTAHRRPHSRSHSHNGMPPFSLARRTVELKERKYSQDTHSANNTHSPRCSPPDCSSNSLSLPRSTEHTSDSDTDVNN